MALLRATDTKDMDKTLKVIIIHRAAVAAPPEVTVLISASHTFKAGVGKT